jgi:hypothetical protein
MGITIRSRRKKESIFSRTRNRRLPALVLLLHVLLFQSISNGAGAEDLNTWQVGVSIDSSLQYGRLFLLFLLFLNSFRGNNCARAKMHLASMIIFKFGGYHKQHIQHSTKNQDSFNMMMALKNVPQLSYRKLLCSLQWYCKPS